MANKPWDRTIVNPRERPLSSDINQLQSQLDRTRRDLMRVAYAYRATDSDNSGGNIPAGFLGDSFKVDPGAGLQVILRQGMGFADGTGDVPSSLGGVIGLDDLSVLKPLALTVPLAIGVPAADPGLPRIDIVEVKYDRRLENPLSRDILDTGTGAFVPALVQKTLGAVLDSVVPSINGAAVVNYKTGTPGASPVEPTVTTGYQKIAAVRVEAAAVSLTVDKIVDRRRELADQGIARVSVTARVNTATGLFTGTPVIIAPPGYRVKLRTDNNLFAAGILGIDCLVAVPSPSSSLGEAGCSIQAFDSAITTSAEALRPVVGNGTMVFTDPSSPTSGGTAVFPSPEPAFPIFGGNTLIASCIPVRWTGATFDQTQLSNPTIVSFQFTIPTK